MIRVRVNIRPSDGWKFVERDGTAIQAGSWRGLVKKVKHYRALNHLAPGNPEDEVTRQTCARSPNHCYDDAGTWKAPQTPSPSLKGRVLQWLSNLYRVTPVFVSPAEAARRAEICMRCPRQAAMEKGCATCRNAVKELEKSILRGRNPDDRLLCCLVLGMYLRVAVWIADDRLNDPSLPNECWRKVKR